MSREFKYTLFLLAFFSVLFGSLCFAGQSDHEEAERQQSQYCEMVSLWNSQPGVSKYERKGWPDYNRNYEQVCK